MRVNLIAWACLWPVLVSAKAKPDAQMVEIKCLIPQEKIADFAKAMDLGSRTPSRRAVCFFDTDALALFQHRPTVILRARYDSGSETDTTVKVRDGTIEGENVACEFDRVIGKTRTMSCSVTDKGERRSRIKRANAGKNIKKIFSKRQEATLENAFGRLNWHTLRPYGPVNCVRVWKNINVPGGPRLTVERWELPAHGTKPTRVVVEVSTKVPLTEEAKTSKRIAELVGLRENENDQEAETKTRIVLEHFKATE